MLKFGAQIVAPVTVEKLTPARSVEELHVLHLDLRARKFVAGCASSLGPYAGDNWKPLEQERFAGAGIYYACTTVEARPL